MPGLPQSPHSLEEALVLFFALLIGHALADYPLQGEYLSTHKNRNYQPKAGEPRVGGLWIHAMTAHSLIQAGFVWAILGRPLFGLVEAGAHFVIDSLKCEKVIGFHTDQLLHVSCKAAYVIVLVYALD